MVELFPVKATQARSSVQPFLPDPFQEIVKRGNPSAITVYPIVGIMPMEDFGEMPPLIFHFHMAVPPAPRGHGFQGSREAIFGRFLSDIELASAGFVPEMGKTKEIKVP